MAGITLFIVEAGSNATLALQNGAVISISSIALGGLIFYNGAQVPNGADSTAIGVNVTPDNVIWALGGGQWYTCPAATVFPPNNGTFTLANPQPSQEIIMSGSNVAPAQTGTVQISGGQGGAGVFPIAFGYFPQEGSRCISAQYNWTANTFFNEDLSQLIARGVETTIQSVFIDNSSVPEPVVLTLAGSGQVLECPANSQGVFPLFFTETPAFQISVASTSPNVTRICLLNVPAQAAGTWSAPPGGSLAAISPPAAPAATNSALAITVSTVLKAGIGRVGKVTVNTAIATGTVTIDDAAVTAAPNTILTIPIGAVVGTVYDLFFPLKVGLTVNFNGTGSVSVSFT